MGRLFAFITQLRNLTTHRVGFRVPNWFHKVRDLPSERTRNIKQHRIVRYCREYGPDWTISVLIDGEYTGIEIRSSDLLDYARIVFRYMRNERGQHVLCLEGVEENHSSDYILRLRYFGFMRNMFWDTRPSVEIHRADSRVATKLRDIEAPPVQYPPTQPVLQRFNRQTASPVRKGEKHTQKATYEEMENKHPVYSSTADRNASTPRMPAPSRTPPDSDISDQSSPKKMPNSHIISKSMNDGKKNGKPDVNTYVPPPEQSPQGSPNHGFITGNMADQEQMYMDIMEGEAPHPPDLENYMDGFVCGILFALALMFGLFIRVR